MAVNETAIVAQLGARMHYAVPRIFAEAGRLERFFTDICAVKGWPKLLRLIPSGLRSTGVRRLLERVPFGVPPNRIAAFNGFGREYARRRMLAATPTEQTAAHLWAGREFARRVIREGLGRATLVYCFNSAGLEILHKAKEEGQRAVTEQTIAPKTIERDLMEQERERFPGWEPFAGPDGLADEFAQREQAEWQSADLIVCGSEFVRDGIAHCGGPLEKCVVVPYGVEAPEARRSKSGLRARRAKDGNPSPRPLRVLTVGAVGLRKGTPYVLEAAQQLQGRAQFRMVGSLGVTREAESRLREHVELAGSVPRSEVAAHFEWADVFLLPSLCEGSATATYEALAWGLPVVCTPNTGSVVRDGLDGFLVPARDVDGIVDRLIRLGGQPDLLQSMSRQALERSTDYTPGAYGGRLLAALTPEPCC